MNETNAHHSLREKQRQEREELILHVAKEVLLEKGYHDTSMDEIATLVGIAKGTLYLHFASKEDLVFALLERELQIAIQTIEQISQMEVNVQEKLNHILCSTFKRQFGQQASLMSVLFNAADLRIALKEKHKEIFKQIADQITTLLDEGKAAGLLDPDVPTEIMLSLFFGVLSPRAYKQLVLEQNMPPEDFIHCVARVYFRGIAAPTSPESQLTSAIHP